MVLGVALPHQPTINVLSILGRTASLSPSSSRRHNSSKQNHTSSSSKSNDYDSLSRHQRSSTSSESSPNYINQKNRSYGRSYRKLRSSSSRSRSRSPRNMHKILNSRKTWSRSPRKYTDRMPKLRRSRSTLPETYQIDCWSQGNQGVQRWDLHFNPPEINQNIPALRQHLIIKYHLGKMCLLHQTWTDISQWRKDVSKYQWN